MDNYEERENNQLLRILQLYPFETGKITLNSSKIGRSTWDVETNQGPKVLKQAQMKPERMLFIANAHIHLQEKGLPIAKLHKTTNGGLCVGANDQAFVLYDKHDGNEVIYYDKDQLSEVMKFAGKFHLASIGYSPAEESKKRSRLGKWQKLFRWKLQELEGNKKVAQTYQDDAFSLLFLDNVNKMLTRGREALQELEDASYTNWTKQSISSSGFCQQDFTFARLIEVDGSPFMKELHSITYDLPSRDLRIILNKIMKKMSVWDHQLAITMLRDYDSVHPLTEDHYRVLWTDLKFPHLFCSIAHKYYLSQKRSWSDEKYLWALQNIIAVETSKEELFRNTSSTYQAIKARKEQG